MPLSPSLAGSSPTGLFAVPRTFEVLYTHLRLYDPCGSAASLSLISCQLQCLFFKEIPPKHMCPPLSADPANGSCCPAALLMLTPSIRQ